MNISGENIRKNILHILPEPSFGGMELMALKLAGLVAEVDHQFCFLYRENKAVLKSPFGFYQYGR